MTAQLFRLPQRDPKRIEVRQRDFAGDLLGLGERKGELWRVYPDLTTVPRARRAVAGAAVLDVRSADEAEAILRAAWEVVAP